MIERYTRPEMGAVWTQQAKFQSWLDVELAATDAWAEEGVVPAAAAAACRGRAAFTVEEVNAREEITNHDVAAFVDVVAASIGEEGRWIHYGLTSSDVLDTALAVQLTKAGEILVEGAKKYRDALIDRAFEFRDTLAMGRTHGVHAEPTTFGVKLAGYFTEFERARRRLEIAREEIAVCAISGAVGTFANVDPAVEEHVAQKLGLAVEKVSTQVIPRDRHAAFFSALAIVASSIERLATEIRHLQRTEVLEAEEYFSPGQKGSSAMPHKRNPVLTENLTGLARLVRMCVIPALENVALWHERDISHSSVERGIGPDATIHLDFALNRLAGVIENLVVYPDRMLENLNRLGGLVHSQRVLLALTQAGASREDAYRLVQRNAMPAWRGEGTLRENLNADKEVAALLSPDALSALFDDAYHAKHVDTIFRRVFGEASSE